MSTEDEKNIPSEETKKNDSFQMLFVLLVVLIICGGNGLGIISGALIWKFAGNIGLAVGVAIGITLLAFGLGMLIILKHNKKKSLL